MTVGTGGVVELCGGVRLGRVGGGELGWEEWRGGGGRLGRVEGWGEVRLGRVEGVRLGRLEGWRELGCEEWMGRGGARLGRREGGEGGV